MAKLTSNTHRVIAQQTVSSETWDWARDASGCWQRINPGTVSGTVEILVDVDALLHAIGRKALHTKSGVTKLQAGAIIVRLVGPKTVTPAPVKP